MANRRRRVAERCRAIVAHDHRPLVPWCHADYGIAEARAWIEHCRQGWADAEHFAYAIFDGAGGELLGAAGLNQRNRLHRSANLGYWVRQSRLGEGIAANAATQVARFGFERLDLIRIEIVVQTDNHASRRTAVKIGARFEAIAAIACGRGTRPTMPPCMG